MRLKQKITELSVCILHCTEVKSFQVLVTSPGSLLTENASQGLNTFKISKNWTTSLFLTGSLVQHCLRTTIYKQSGDISQNMK